MIMRINEQNDGPTVTFSWSILSGVGRLDFKGVQRCGGHKMKVPVRR